MKKVRIKLIVLGHMPRDFFVEDIQNWRSSVLDIDPSIETIQLSEDAEGSDWQYTDSQLDRIRVDYHEGGFTLVLMSVKLQDNWYARRQSGNKVFFTFFELDHVLRQSDLPLSNVVLRVLYAGCLSYRRFGNRVPESSECTNFAHDETRGCLFDMNPSKVDVLRSCDQPVICGICTAKLLEEGVSAEFISSVRREIVRIRKPLFRRLVDFAERHPVRAFVASTVFALALGVISSLIAEYMLAIMPP